MSGVLKIAVKGVTSLFKNSIIYRLLSTSWFLGWMVAVPAPEENQVAVCPVLTSPAGVKQNMETKKAPPLVCRLGEACLRVLYRSGNIMRKLGKGSVVINNLWALIGISLFFYLVFDLVQSEYGRLRMLMQAVLALSSLLLPLHKFIPGLWQGSKILSFFSWWGRTD